MITDPYEIVLERNGRRWTIRSPTPTLQEALVDALRARSDPDAYSVGSVEIRHNNSPYSVVGCVRRTEGEMYIEEVREKGLFLSGGVEITVRR